MTRYVAKVLFCAACALSFGFLILSYFQKKTAPDTTLLVYCAAGLKNPSEKAAAEFQRLTGESVSYQFGGTATLLSQIHVAQMGDLFIAADQDSLEDARKLGVLREVLPLVVQHPVVAVKKGNPLNVRELKDLYREDVKVAIANPESASVGKRTRAVFASDWELFFKKVAVTKPTVAEIAADVSLGAVDAAIVWDSTVHQFENLEAVAIPELMAKKDIASVAVLSTAKDPAGALRFARFLASELGNEIFKAGGFTSVPGDAWALEPVFVLYSGGVNRPAIEHLLTRFSNREGVRITTIFNGCGILCASMKAVGESSNGAIPDAYFACDLCFIPPVAKQFPEVTLLTETRIGIVVQKNNPHGIKIPADLAKPGLRLGLCNAEQSTLGFMTTGILRDLKLEDAVRKNVSVEVPTADFLINQMRAGGIDAAIVYSVNAIPQSAHLEFIPIQHKGALAVQPFAVAANSPRRQMGGRLLVFLKENRAEFEKAGFVWRGESKPMKSSEIEIPEWLKPQ